MLSLSGNSETAFAGLNSFNVNPLVYAEWNYNNITKVNFITNVYWGENVCMRHFLNIFILIKIYYI